MIRAIRTAGFCVKCFIDHVGFSHSKSIFFHCYKSKCCTVMLHYTVSSTIHILCSFTFSLQMNYIKHQVTSKAGTLLKKFRIHPSSLSAKTTMSPLTHNSCLAISYFGGNTEDSLSIDINCVQGKSKLGSARH